MALKEASLLLLLLLLAAESSESATEAFLLLLLLFETTSESSTEAFLLLLLLPKSASSESTKSFLLLLLLTTKSSESELGRSGGEGKQGHENDHLKKFQNEIVLNSCEVCRSRSVTHQELHVVLKYKFDLLIYPNR